MSEQTAQEPTMEEILASIRRIISEDDQPAEAKAEEAPVAAAPEPVAEPEPSPAMMDETPSVQAEEEVLELTQRVEEPAPVQTLGDIDIAPRAETPPPPPAPEPEPAPYVAPTPQYQMGATASLGGNPTIEDLVRSILEPQIREWVAQNLDGIMRDITRDMVREKLERVFK